MITPLSPVPASIIICTKDRPNQLNRCLSSVVTQLLPEDELLVIDNSQTGSGEAVATSFGVRWIVEKRPGSSWARNRGYIEASRDIIIYIDDDCIADSFWLQEIRSPFNNDKIDVVTGSVLAYQPNLAIPYLIDAEYSLHRGWKEKLYVASTGTRWTPFDIWRVGVGATMAWRKSVLEKINGFDPALGVGTPAGSSEDIDAFRRALIAQATILYLPSALVWHDHPQYHHELNKMILRYSISLGAHAAKIAFEEKKVRGITFLLRDWYLQWRSVIKAWLGTTNSNGLHLPAHTVLLQPAASLFGMLQFMKHRQALRNARHITKHKVTPSSKADIPPPTSGVQSIEVELDQGFQDFNVPYPSRVLFRKAGRPLLILDIPAHCSLLNTLKASDTANFFILSYFKSTK